MTESPPPVPAERKEDTEHLRLLTIFHFILAGLSLLGIGFLAAHYTVMRVVFMNPEIWKNQKGPPPPPEIFAMMQWFYVFFGFILVTAALGNLLSGLFMKRRKHRTFSLIIAGLDCFQIPFGTALGVFTFIVLLRDSVRDAYKNA